MAEEIVISGAVRTPIGTFGGVFTEVHPAKLGAIAIAESLKRAGVDANSVDEVLFGNVIQGGQGMNIARQAAIQAGIPVEATATTINQACASGLRAVAMAAQQIREGDSRIIVAGGTESMSTAPYILRKARFGYRMGNGELVDAMIADGLTCSIETCHMGITAENVAAEMGISREDQDQFAVESQTKAVAAMESGRFKDEIIPVEVPQGKGQVMLVEKDEHPRPGTTLEKVAKLRPAFKPDGTVTAGNASGINDGAAAAVVMSASTAKELGVKPQARIVGYAWAGVAPRVMGLGPVPAIKKVLEKTGLSLSDLDLIELNEAFAAQSLGVIRQLDLDRSKLNVNGGAIALGHPVGASGTRVLVTLMYEMAKRKSKLGMATLCVGGGQGIAMIVENLM
ncbi:MAG TPA: acetyl-CoA C-acetyltransferase [Chloroflexota bacterium]